MVESNEVYNFKFDLLNYQYPTIDLLEDDYINNYISIKSVLNSDIFQNTSYDLLIDVTNIEFD